MRVFAGCRLCAGALACLLGASVVQGLPDLPPGWVGPLTACLALAAFALRPLRPAGWLCLGIAWALIRADLTLSGQLPSDLEGRDLRVEGVVTSLVQRTGPHLRFEFTTHRAARSQGHSFPPSTVLLKWYHAQEDVRVGQGWRLTVRLKRPHGFQNPGGFDREKWLFRKRIRATGYVRSARRLPKLDGLHRWDRLREHIQRFLGRSELRNQGLIRALAIGDRGGVDQQQWRILVRTGTLHLLAISGLHIGLVSGLGFVLGSVLTRALGPGLLWIPAPVGGALSAVLAGGVYALLAGLTIPTQRAFIMVAAVMAAVLLRRPVGVVHCLATALLVVLLVDPLSVLDSGFWLSFGAVAAIVLASKATEDSGGRLVRAVRIQILLSVLLAPFVLFFFGRVSLVAPVANLIAIPVVALAVVPLVLLASLMLVPEAEGAAGSLYAAADFLLTVLFAVLELFSAPDWAMWSGGGYWTIVAMLVLARIGTTGHGFKRACRWLWAPLLAMFVVGRWNAGSELEAGEFSMTVLDVGQGLSIFLETRRHTLLYDTGARFSPRFDAGSAVIVPYLRHRGIDALDMLVLSHGDNDHVGGMAAVLGEVEVRDRISSVPEKVPSARPCLAGDGWEWDGVRFAILSPADLGVPDHNNASCVIKITGDSGSALLTGDIEKEVEAELASSFPEALGSEVLLVPHQGSKTSSTAHFIDLVSAEIAVVSTGYRNRYGHPDATVVRRYRMRNTPLFNTALDGAITVRVAGGRIAVESYRDTGRRYWFARAGG